ncbi:hypothetical protein PHYPSEUDO_011077 [Phytophthora pseudosyringae]|uniref:Uncharacterized protein n=1 Tax=Phytophthora pseudosyringae TaxID=221518 RepID=A0A8T1V8W1_9STRA|nr:hypothetical protein PHYPSEUDO_011077 [Phytophthora pseudosyringae]
MEDQHLDGFEIQDQDHEAAEDVEMSPAPTTPLDLNHAHVDPPPFLDVLSFHSSRLLPESRKDVAARELQLKKKAGIRSYANSSTSKSSVTLTPEEEAARLDELLSSVHLLLEPIQLPDLSHTGVFDPATSLLRPVTPRASASKPVTKLKLSKLDKSDEIKLFYPTGAKNANMRDYIKETIQKHFSTADPPLDKALGASASAPMFRPLATMPDFDGQQHSVSPSKTRTSSKNLRKKSKPKGIKSPVKASLTTTGALLNPQLTRQAKDAIAAVRANSSKINDLIS